MAFDIDRLSHQGIKQILPYVPGKPIEEVAREFGLTHVLKMASNENPLGCSEQVVQVIKELAGQVFLYPDGDCFTLKQALSRFYGVAKDQLAIANGSNEILELIPRIFAGPGQEIIYSQYAFAIYPLVAQAVGATRVEVSAQSWGHDLKAMLAAITPRTRVIFIANPNNPTGTWLTQSELISFLEQIPEHVVVVLDEAYFEYAQDTTDYPNGFELINRCKQLVVTRTFSKVYGLAGLRVGYALGDAKIIDLINRVRQPFNINLLAQHAAVAALNDPQHVRNSIHMNTLGLRQLTDAFERMGLEYIPSIGNFISVRVGEAAHLYKELLKKGIIVRPMASYQMSEFLRISIGREQENELLINTLKSLMA